MGVAQSQASSRWASSKRTGGVLLQGLDDALLGRVPTIDLRRDHLVAQPDVAVLVDACERGELLAYARGAARLDDQGGG